ncbi:MAG: glycine cleavage T C-terminal barrel domain-containing protein, partial [Candidatus Bathyarchaeia archaeon]
SAMKHGGEACGLLARDTLRIEAGLCLYGWDIDDSTSPVEAKLNFALDFDHDFIGKPAIIKQRESGPTRIRVGIKMNEAGIPRQGMSILSTEGKVGVITSGTYSPLLKIGVGMGYVPKEKSTPGTTLQVEIRGKSTDCEVAKFPLYDANRYGWKRKQTARE